MNYKYLGNLSAVEPAYSQEMHCHECKVSWTGCWDNFTCPECDKGNLPTIDPESLCAEPKHDSK